MRFSVSMLGRPTVRRSNAGSEAPLLRIPLWVPPCLESNYIDSKINPRHAAASAAFDAQAAAAKMETEQNNFEAPIPEIAEHNFEAPIPETNESLTTEGSRNTPIVEEPSEELTNETSPGKADTAIGRRQNTPGAEELCEQTRKADTAIGRRQNSPA